MPGPKKFWQWRWMPITVLFIGLLSIVQIRWVQRINERLRIDDGYSEAILDVQIKTVLYHLRLEEVLNHDTEETDSTKEEALSALDQAITVVNATLSGGILEHGIDSEPLTDPALRARAEAIKALLVKFKDIGLDRLRNPGKARIGIALERQFEAVFKETFRKTKDLEAVLEIQRTRNRSKSRRLFRSILSVWTVLVATASAGLWLLERQRKGAEDELIKVNRQLLDQTEELRQHRENLAALVEKRAVELTTTNVLLTNEIAERRHAEETLKESEKRTETLASRLINAQEIERRRIAMELHDELGQALNAMKLHLRVIENGLEGDQRATREECEKLQEYLDNVIEDVRRLSLALSPTVLEDLGLTAAIQWLVSGFAKYPAAKVTADIEEIDHYVPDKHRIAIYRVLQEVLTNIRKHARAEHVSIVIRRHDDTVAFSVEDDGTGFDPNRELMKAASEKGLGLATMSERVRVAGGILELWSQEGKGTRITFSIPIGKGRA
jgi:signal transduction histidine kinase